MIHSYEQFRAYRQAGVIARAIKYLLHKHIVQRGVLVDHEVYRYSLRLMQRLNCTPLFPPNICGPGVLVHDTIGSTPRQFRQGLCKVDIGLTYRGAWIDTAFTVALNTHTDTLTAYREAFQRVESALQVGLSVSALGGLIQKIYSAQGFYVVPWLAGHTIGHTLHEEPLMLNIANDRTGEIHQGQVFTIEPFVTLTHRYTVVEHSEKIVATETGFTLGRETSEPIIARYPVYTLERRGQPVESLQEQHTYVVWQGIVHRVS